MNSREWRTHRAESAAVPGERGALAHCFAGEHLRQRPPFAIRDHRRGHHMTFRRAGVVAGILAAMVASDAARAQPVGDFYQGKDIRVLIGAGVGGTYHLYAMLASRYMRKHIPGQPTMTLMTMPGAGGITAMNHSYNVAPKDGTVIHLIHAEVLFETLLSPGVMFNAKDYHYIGRFADADFAGVVSKRSGVRTLD